MISRKVTTIPIKKAAAVIFLFFVFIPWGQAAVFNVIYIEAAEGNSSGGHLAVQFGSHIFHYQYDNGMIRLFKDNADHFKTDYLYRQNRSLHLAEIEVSNETLDQLENTFNFRFFSQQQESKLLQNLQVDQHLLQALLDLKAANPSRPHSDPQQGLQLPGAGLFYSDDNPTISRMDPECDTAVAGEQVISELKQRVSINAGENFLSEKYSTLTKQINELSPLINNIDISTYHYSFSEHYKDLLTNHLALNVLSNVQPLSGNACFIIDDPKLDLDDEEIKYAASFKTKLFKTAQSLLISNRPDWGYALLITLARLIVLEDSILKHHWTFLEDGTYEDNGISKEQVALYAESMLNKRHSDRERLHRNAQRVFSDSEMSEKYYGELELAANRYHHWLQSDYTGRLNIGSEQPLPHKGTPANRFLMTRLSISQLRIALDNRKSMLKIVAEKDSGHNTYHLITKNCVTAIFSLINSAVSGHAKESFGGYIDPQLNFVPFQAFDAVQSTYHVKRINHLPAYRQEKLTNLYNLEDGNLVYLRESNIFSSSLYNYNPDDAWFIFFTDDKILPRPLFGLFNVAAATSQSLLGLISWPYDNGKAFKTGLRGVMASLPELAFFNIRKGSYPLPLKN